MRESIETLAPPAEGTVSNVTGWTSEATPPAVGFEVLASPVSQGSSSLFAVELLARLGLHRAVILNSDRFVSGMISESMLISLISQYKSQIPSFCQMPVSQLLPFLLPHRLVTVDESAITAEAYSAMVRERVSGAAVVNEKGVLVDTLSARDLRCIGAAGSEFERLWMIVREFKEQARQMFKEVTPHRQHWVAKDDRMIDILAGMSDGNLHRGTYERARHSALGECRVFWMPLIPASFVCFFFFLAFFFQSSCVRPPRMTCRVRSRCAPSEMCSARCSSS